MVGDLGYCRRASGWQTSWSGATRGSPHTFSGAVRGPQAFAPRRRPSASRAHQGQREREGGRSIGCDDRVGAGRANGPRPTPDSPVLDGAPAGRAGGAPVDDPYGMGRGARAERALSRLDLVVKSPGGSGWIASRKSGGGIDHHGSRSGVRGDQSRVAPISSFMPSVIGSRTHRGPLGVTGAACSITMVLGQCAAVPCGGRPGVVTPMSTMPSASAEVFLQCLLMIVRRHPPGRPWGSCAPW
jgi:hypothetical protein